MMNLKKVSDKIRSLINDPGLYVYVREYSEHVTVSVEYSHKLHKFFKEELITPTKHRYTKDTSFVEIEKKTIESYSPKTQEKIILETALSLVDSHRKATISFLVQLVDDILTKETLNEEWDKNTYTLLQRWFEPLKKDYL